MSTSGGRKAVLTNKANGVSLEVVNPFVHVEDRTTHALAAEADCIVDGRHPIVRQINGVIGEWNGVSPFTCTIGRAVVTDQLTPTGIALIVELLSQAGWHCAFGDACLVVLHTPEP